MAVHFQVQESQFLSQYEKGVVNLICANKASTLLNKEDALKPKVQLLAQPNKKKTKEIFMLSYTGSLKKTTQLLQRNQHIWSHRPCNN
jgi:hypothetical protein